MQCLGSHSHRDSLRTAFGALAPPSPFHLFGRIQGKAENSSLTSHSEEQEAQADYECKTRPEGLFLRNNANARPRNPVPSNSREEGSGVALEMMSEVSTAGPPLTSA